MEDKPVITLAYWRIRGYIELPKLILEFGKISYKVIWYQEGPPPERDRSCFRSIKHTLGLEFPNLPYLYDGDLKMSESMAINIYLMHQYVPELLGSNPRSKAKVMEGLWVVRSVKELITFGSYEKDRALTDASVVKATIIMDKIAAKMGDN